MRSLCLLNNLFNPMDSVNTLKIINARENNLKNVSVEIKHDTLTVLTGLSGSGKSSLAFDTVYAEGQRRYIETFSPYTRQFFDKVKKPDVDLIENVRPAIAIQQRTKVTSSRSTVGSLTNINEYLKIIWSNYSSPICKSCGVILKKWTPEELADRLLSLKKIKSLSTFYIAAPVQLPKDKALASKEIHKLIESGFTRYFDREKQAINHLDNISTSAKELLIVLERIRSDSTPDTQRLKDSIETAFSLTNGKVVFIEPHNRRTYRTILNTPSQRNVRPGSVYYDLYTGYYSCSESSIVVTPPRPSLFSYNNPYGVCSNCKGFGHVLEIDQDLVIPDKSKTIEEKAIACWSTNSTKTELKRLLRFCENKNIRKDIPWRELPVDAQNIIFEHVGRDFTGINRWFHHVEKKRYKLHIRVFLSRYRKQVVCSACRGKRLNPDALVYHIKGNSIGDIFDTQVKDLLPWFLTLKNEFESSHKLPQEMREVFSSLITNLVYLVDLGLGYLTLNRQAKTLSGGETQRVNLVTALGSEMTSTHFVLDEPSVGLHPRDTQRLLQSIIKLRDRGNSILLVEHDPECIFSADEIIELGPRAGKAGGEIIFQGPPTIWDKKRIAFQSICLNPKQNVDANPKLYIKNASGNNLKNFSVSIPLNCLVSITGVSGSGKTTLARDVILKAYELHKTNSVLSDTNQIAGFENIDNLYLIDQSPISKTPRANLATYLSIWDAIRTLFAGTDDAISKALSKSHFSFNAGSGRCPTCLGAGFVREDMQFLSDVFIPCETCLGIRFQPSVLSVRYKGKNVDDVLKMTVDEGLVFFSEYPNIQNPLSLMSVLGLGHLTLGHPLSELSGGEAQRLKLIPFIDRSTKKRTLLIFDEPTTGLHTRDVEKLVLLFRTLISHGNSVLCVEHNLGLIASSDWLIDLGPEGGMEGGFLIKSGAPFDFYNNPEDSITAYYLKRFFDENQSGFFDKAPAVLNGHRNHPTELFIRGAREHNLKNVDVTVPLNQFVVLTGVSGSGKSTVAKDIVYAEAQHRYLDCLSPYARQFIKGLHRPDINSIENVKPTVCVYQHTFQPSRSSTVGTMSEIYNFLRLLFSKLGIQYCPKHPNEIVGALSADEIVQIIKSSSEKSVRVLAPIIKKKKGHHRQIFDRALFSEITEVRVDGIFVTPGSVRYDLERTKVHSIDFVVGKFNPNSLDSLLIKNTVEEALALGGGSIILHTPKDEILFSSGRTCPVCKRGFYKPDPEDLSFHSKRGSCKRCKGEGYLKGQVCEACQGTRLNEIGQNIRLNGLNIGQVSRMVPSELKKFLSSISFDERRRAVAIPVLGEINHKIDTLVEVGLDYIDLNRDCSTLSGGELQRLRLATAMGSPLTGALYIFDEPSIGLHPSDNIKVLSRLRSLNSKGNSLVVIEHDPQTILSSDYTIEMGPGGGRKGGSVVFTGPTLQLMQSNLSATAHAFKEQIRVATRNNHTSSSNFLKISNGNLHNLRYFNAKIPLNKLVVIAGVSGAGKSTLVHGMICQTVKPSRNNKNSWSSELCEIQSSTTIDRALLVDQKPIGINSRSTPASYLGIWDEIRKLFARTVESKACGYSPGFFSYNAGKGRCPECRGLGVTKLEMSFLPDATIECELCGGKRYTDDALAVKYLNLSINDVLSLTFEEALDIFINHRKIHPILHMACELGLGYLTIGQPSSTLSGGESQRIKLVSELGRRETEHTLYLLDEPTTGLHMIDVARLTKTLRRLVDRGNSVIIIEHDQALIRESDYIIELGPGAGQYGGKIIYEGDPFLLSKAKTPWGAIISKGSFLMI